MTLAMFGWSTGRIVQAHLRALVSLSSLLNSDWNLVFHELVCTVHRWWIDTTRCTIKSEWDRRPRLLLYHSPPSPLNLELCLQVQLMSEWVSEWMLASYRHWGHLLARTFPSTCMMFPYSQMNDHLYHYLTTNNSKNEGNHGSWNALCIAQEASMNCFVQARANTQVWLHSLAMLHVSRNNQSVSKTWLLGIHLDSIRITACQSAIVATSRITPEYSSKQTNKV